jgi:hypothetical protein
MISIFFILVELWLLLAYWESAPRFQQFMQTPGWVNISSSTMGDWILHQENKML